jgi:hypothetical protein
MSTMQRRSAVMSATVGKRSQPERLTQAPPSAADIGLTHKELHEARIICPVAAGVIPKKNPCPEAKPAEVFRRSAPLETVRRKTYPRILNDLVTVELRDLFVRSTALQCGMADNRTISQLEAEGYPWIGCECCKGTVWVPFRMLRERLPMLSAMTLDQLGAKLICDRCGEGPERYCPANQSETPGFVRRL